MEGDSNDGAPKCEEAGGNSGVAIGYCAEVAPSVMVGGVFDGT